MDMYGDDEPQEEQPKQLGPMAMLARKVDRLESELRDAKAEIAALRQALNGSLQQMRSRVRTTETALDTIRNNR